MKNLITYCTILLCLSTMLLGCYSQKKATQQLYKVQVNYPEIVARLCSDIYPPVAAVKDSIVYLLGKREEELVFVEVDCDSVYKSSGAEHAKVKISCPPSIYRVDTLLVYKEKQVVDRAQIEVLGNDLSELSVTHAKKQKENYILLRATIILGLYTVLRWVLRIWKFKLP